MTGVSDKTHFTTTSGEYPTTSPGTGPHSPGPTQSDPSSSSTTDNEYYGGNTQTQSQSHQQSTTSRYGSSPIDNRYTTTERYPGGASNRPQYGSSSGQPSSSGYDAGSSQTSNKPPTAYGTGYSTGHSDARPGYYGGTATAHGYDGWPSREREQGYGAHPNAIGGTYYPYPSQYPTYQYPMPYEKNYPMPNYPMGPPTAPTAGSYPYQRPYQPPSSGSSYPSNPPSHYPTHGGSAPSYSTAGSGTGPGQSAPGYGGAKPSVSDPLKNGTRPESSGYGQAPSGGVRPDMSGYGQAPSGGTRPEAPGYSQAPSSGTGGYNVHEPDQEKKRKYKTFLFKSNCIIICLLL